MTVKVDIRMIVRLLNENLGTTLVATLAGSHERHVSRGWALSDGPLPDEAAEVRLRAAQDVWETIVRQEDPQTIRNWFLGDSPQLEEPPVMALRAGRLDEVRQVAIGMTEGAWQL
jgi:hypothetical protein